MALIYDTTGKAVANVPVQQVLKGFESLLIETDQTWDNSNGVTFRIYIQRPQSKDILLTEGGLIPFKEAVMLAAVGETTISCSPEGFYSYKIDLTTGGNVPLSGGESIRFEFKGLDSTKSWKFYSKETFAQATHVFRYGQKILASNLKKETYSLHNFDAILLQKNVGVDYFQVEYYNGALIEHEPEELDIDSRSFDPIQLITSAGVAKTGFTNYIVLPAKLYNSITVNKDDSAQFSLYYREIA